ncbi:MAG: hypothetical protein DMENIID0002_10170 [Rickettsia endosymbiont of Sergentomyia squamirostris]|uniref:Uncharacterized protein n=1 Tax=Candidatus Tisiphia endosymbiont of Sergentomyia squamirostris TaxID=3113639 RepID=A0AAT9G9I3_9RICK
MTEKIIDRIKAHFDAKEIKVIEVIEWGDDENPLYIHCSPLTLAQKNRLYKMAKEDDLGLMLEALIMKAKDIEGNCLFSRADKPNLMRNCDPDVLIRVATSIMESSDIEVAEKN